MAKKHKKRFKIKASKLKSIQPLQPKATSIQGIKTAKVLKTQPIPVQPKPTNPHLFKTVPTPKPKLDSFEKSFLKLSKSIKNQKRQQNQLNQQKKVFNNVRINNPSAKTTLKQWGNNQGKTLKFNIDFLKTPQDWKDVVDNFGTKGTLTVLNNTIKWFKELNIKTNKLENRLKKLSKKELTTKMFADLQLQFKKVIKKHKIPSIKANSGMRTSSFNKKQRTAYWYENIEITIASVLSKLMERKPNLFFEDTPDEIYIVDDLYWEQLSDSLGHIDFFNDIVDLSKSGKVGGMMLYRLTPLATKVYKNIKSGNNPYEGKKALVWTLEPEMI